jgi:dolichyl-phosphate beta-glucosyltransferase
MDSDNGTDISNFEKMRPLFDKGYDVVISSRDRKDAEGAGQLHPQPWLKRQMGNMGNLYIQIVAGLWGIWDTQNGFKAFRDYAAERIFKLSKINRWTFDVEVLALSKKFNYKIGVVGIMWVDDPDSRVNLWGYVKSLLDVARFKWSLVRGRYDEKQ